MQTEVEAKFLHVDFDAIRIKLEALGAICEQPMRLMKRAILDDPEGKMQTKEAYIRVRDEGDKITLTYKQFDALSVDGAKEIEVTVDNFEDTVTIFTQIGLVLRSVQETRRETWKLGDVEVVLDEWPWLHPFIEVEGPNESTIKNAAEQLGFSWKEAVYGDVMAAYRVQYPHLSITQSVVELPEVRFGDPLPNFLKSGV